MKRIALVVGLAVVLCVLTIWAHTAAPKSAPEQSNMAEKNWMPEQQEPLNAFSRYIKVALRGNLEEMKTFWHPNIVSWDLKQDIPMNYSEFLKGEADFLKSFKFKKLDFTPLAIQVEGKTAIIHLKYDDVYTDLTGKEISASGNWTTVMVKQDKSWIILSNAWAER